MSAATKTARLSARVWMLKHPFDGPPRPEDFELREEELRDIGDGELICEAEYLSVDPYMRAYMGRFSKFPCAMIGTQVAKVIESKNTTYPVGSYIYGHFGWRSRTLVTDLGNPAAHPVPPYPCPDTGSKPRSYALGCLGRVGNSAYFGLNELCRPKCGETVVVSGAAGAVGCLVGQLAKLQGCRVVGIAGGARKCEWLLNEMGFDATIDYKSDAMADDLERATPNGVDCYFDNVGGMISYLVQMRMNQKGRIAVCGSVSTYNDRADELPMVPQVTNFHRRNLRMEGFLVNRWLDRWFEGIDALRVLLNDGKIKNTETVTEGFDRMPVAFIEMLRGVNFGKAIVKV